MVKVSQINQLDKHFLRGFVIGIHIAASISLVLSSQLTPSYWAIRLNQFF